MRGAGLTNEEWVARLAERFFRPEYEMAHVLFYVDRPLLADVAGATEEEAVMSLVNALMGELRPRAPRELFSPLKDKTASWKVGGGESPPPCLGALALSVLAATEMRSEKGRAAHNYYDWFRDLIALGGSELDPRAVEHAYRDAFPFMWKALRWWLDEKHHGGLGVVPNHIVHPGLLGGWGCHATQIQGGTPDEDSR